MSIFSKLFGSSIPAQGFNSEFSEWMKSVHEMSTKSDYSMERKKKELSKALNKLSQESYDLYFPYIVDIIQKSKDKCQQFKNTAEQVTDILSWLPRMNEKRALLVAYIQERRKKYKLEV